MSKRGKRGKRGYTGDSGLTGPTGATGAEGARLVIDGDPVTVKIYARDGTLIWSGWAEEVTK